MDVADAAPLSIPHIVLASKDEPADAVTGYTRVIESNESGGHVETYATMWHGWMGLGQIWTERRVELSTREGKSLSRLNSTLMSKS
jgi:hypothetical protein